MTMKKVLLILLITAVGMTGLKAQNSLTVTLADGTQHVYQLSERPEMLWEGDNIIISTAINNTNCFRKTLYLHPSTPSFILCA